jgi:two-component system response regulator FlrC
MQEVLALARRFGPSEASVLLTGESGTGKEEMARELHEASRRANGPFVAVNCAAIPETLLETELFGHARGAFTGAATARTGRFETANGGTLLLDEITEMEPRLQAKLLRVLQERTVDRVGGELAVPVDVRVIATSNRELQREVAAGRFRQDLYYRLAVLELQLPPLRERREDIALLAHHFAQRFAASNGLPQPRITAAALQVLQRRAWPGNVRELENCMHRAVILAAEGVIEAADVADPKPSPAPPSATRARPEVGRTLAELERELILETLQRLGGNRTRAAEMLGISVRTLRNKLAEYLALGAFSPHLPGTPQALTH